jgi:hypothetical protein
MNISICVVVYVYYCWKALKTRNIKFTEKTNKMQPLRWLSHRSGQQPKTYIKPETAITVFELLMMGGVSPETC